MNKKCVILLNGYPGVGKSAIARALQSKLPESSTTRLIDNHLDIAEAIHPERGDAYQELCKDVHKVAIPAVGRELRDHGDLTVIMTSSFVNNEEDITALREYMKITKRGESRFYFINIWAEWEEHRRRLVDAARYTTGIFKLRDEGTIFELMNAHELIEKEDVGWSWHYEAGCLSMKLDTTRLSVDQSATEVLKLVGKC